MLKVVTGEISGAVYVCWEGQTPSYDQLENELLNSLELIENDWKEIPLLIVGISLQSAKCLLAIGQISESFGAVALEVLDFKGPQSKVIKSNKGHAFFVEDKILNIGMNIKTNHRDDTNAVTIVQRAIDEWNLNWEELCDCINA